MTSMNDTNEEFYLSLLSDSSHNFFPENKATNFYTQLPKSVQLDGRWACALTEFQIPCTILTVQDGQNIIYLKHVYNKADILKNINIFMKNADFRDWLLTHVENPEDNISVVEMLPEELILESKTRIESGNYDSIEDLVNALNTNPGLIRNDVKISLNSGSKKLTVTCSSSELVKVVFAPKLSLQLGFLRTQTW